MNQANDPYPRYAIQKGNVGSTYIYCLHLENGQSDTYVVRGKAGNIKDQILHLSGDVAGHTRTHANLGICRYREQVVHWCQEN
ncbi:hypothetical protein ME800_17630 [Lactobacillus delbrueckii]|nr:hypothetical protein ME800_17630 [Lactobacillus delbrueckii]